MKFRPAPWAQAFVDAAGDISVAEEALEYVRVFCRAALMVPGDLSGRSDAERLGQCVEAALARASGTTDAAGFASRFVQLMLRKNCLYQYKGILRGIEKAIHKQKGIEEVIVETAKEPDNELLSMVKEKALLLTGAKEVTLISRVIPDLIGGIRLRWGSIVLDGSVKQRLEKMAGSLGAACLG